MVRENRVSETDLEELARTAPAFRSKYEQAKQILASLPNPQECEEYNAIEAAVRERPDDNATYHQVEQYLNKWRGAMNAAEHLASAEDMFKRLQERYFFRTLRQDADAAIQEYNKSGRMPASQLVQALKNFVSTYGPSSYAAPDVQLLRDKLRSIEELFSRSARESWQKLLDEQGRLRDIRTVQPFLMQTPAGADLIAEIDDKAWEWVLRQPELASSIRSYCSIFVNGARHYGEAQTIMAQIPDWESAFNSIPAIVMFLQRYPDTPLREMAQNRMAELKETEIDRLRKDPRMFTVEDFRSLLASGYSLDELLDAAGMSEEMYNSHIADNNYEKIRKLLPAEPDCDTHFSEGLGEEGLTDIILFGITSSGKTCVLSGLLNHPDLGFDDLRFSSDYATLVSQYAKYGISLKGTPKHFVATIKAWVNRLGSKEAYDFNLFEMAGEAFSDIKKHAKENPDHFITDIEAMGGNVAKILRTPNNKVLFFLIDPTVGLEQREDQELSMRAIVNLLFSPENDDVMEKVIGIHFIVTKSDTLPEGDPREKALEAVQRVFRRALIDMIIQGCRDKGVNINDNEQLNGRPRIYPFSLGRFTVGNMYEYDPKSSGEILQVICDYCVPRRKVTAGYKVLDFLSKPRF